MSSTTVNPADARAYARFTRRLQAVFIDAIVLMLAMTAALIVATSAKYDNAARVLGFAVALFWLLYEPLLVSATGSTVGHYFCNLRVVDNRGGNPSFGKALLRMAIKHLLGLYSFLAMAVTRRHQAVHDLLTKSTVQMRSQAIAEAHHFRLEREAIAPAGLPSPARRAAVIVVYLGVWSAVFLAVIAIFSATGVVTDRCIDTDSCSILENVLIVGVSLGWLLGIVALLFYGWRGRLWGARRNAAA